MFGSLKDMKEIDAEDDRDCELAIGLERKLSAQGPLRQDLGHRMQRANRQDSTF